MPPEQENQKQDPIPAAGADNGVKLAWLWRHPDRRWELSCEHEKKLPHWSLNVKGDLNREEIYDRHA